jgi:HAE1 family hydrophobic/amphiphilic exporter-1
MSSFFLHRPVFAWVIAIAMMLAGGLAIHSLPVAQYPPIAPPSISIRAFYTGASASTVEDSVVQIIEQKMTGLDRMLYMQAVSDSSGSAEVTLTFAPGTDPDLAWAKVQNKLQLALPALPEVVQRQGVTVSKSTRNYLLMVGITSTDGSMDQDDLNDYAVSQIQNLLARVRGVGEVEVFGSGYAMRIWLDPDRLTKYGMTSDDVVAAIRAYNVEVSAGQFGGAPAVPGQRLNASILVQSLLVTPEEFAAIPLRTDRDGSMVRVRDVGRTELGTDFADIRIRFNGQPAAILAVRQEAGANALETADRIKSTLTELSAFFPAGLAVIYPFDTTPFVKVAIAEVVRTLFEAIVLVFLVMYLFLGNLRATLIPTIAVPVVILGTFGVLGALGYSINMLTMFAMVLAIGLLVDDAIVVVENVERVMSEEGLPPWEATRRSMQEITSALVGIGLVLAAVFGPMMFFPGSTGVIYRQFSVTVIASMLLSVVVALVLTPVLCAALLRPVARGHEAAETGFRPLRPFFLAFDRMFNRTRDAYLATVGHILGRPGRFVVVFLLLVGGLVFLYGRMPTGYLPDEDQGSMMAMVQLPVGSTLEQTRAVLDEVQRHFLVDQKEAVASCMTVAGMGFAGRGQNQGMAFVKLRDWGLRNREDLRAPAVAGRAMGALSGIRGAIVFAFPPPAVVELGIATGFDFMLQDRGGLGHAKLSEARDQLLGMAAGDRRLNRVRPNGMLDVPQYKVDVDWEKAGALGVPVSSVQSYLSAAFGSAYVGNFVQGGRVKRVFAQADAPFRMLPSDLERLFVRNLHGGLVPLSALASGRWVQGSPRLERFNSFPAMNIQGEPAPGRSSGEAMRAMEELARPHPAGRRIEWTGLSNQQRMSESQAGLLYAFSVLVIFLVLAALYESWTVPISIVLALPLGVIGGVLASSLRGLANDVYFQIGLLTVLGLTTKNAILIVQFAKAHLDEGMGLIEATLQGARLRLRPIVMTSLAFGFGVLPLAIASGAGAGAQRAIGTSVLGGMLSATFLAVLFIPLFFVLVVRLFEKRPAPVAVLQPLLVLLAALGLSACTMIPKYDRPRAPVPPAWSEDAATEGALAAELPWQEFFTDQRLRGVIELALANNRDLRAAALAIERAEAVHRIQGSGLYPGIGAQFGGEKTRLPEKVTEDGVATTAEQYSVHVGTVAWELDLFGRIRSLKASALEQYLATLHARRAAQMSLIAAVASTHLALAADLEALALARATLESEQASYELLRRSREVGIASELDLRQVQSQVESARVAVARFTGLAAVDRHALDLLAGTPVPAELLPERLAVVTQQDLAPGLPSDVLLRRPDILAAEHQLRAANANIGAARAAFFPRISLTAALGTLSPQLSELFSEGTRTWTFVPQAVTPLWAGGLQRANLKAARVDREIAVAGYEKAIQSAFAEVDDGLALRQSLLQQREAQVALVDALQRTYDLYGARHRAGIDGYLGVLVAQRALFTGQQVLIGVRLAEQLNRVTLYKVLGGGA